MSIFIEEYTPTSLMSKRGYSVALTLIKQSEIFNCSLDETWEKHIHQAVHQANKKEDVIHLAEEILAENKKLFSEMVTNKPRKGYQCILSEHALLVQYVLEEGRYRLEIYKGDNRIYRHMSLSSYPFEQTSIILRKKLGITKVNLKWERF